MFKVKKGCLFVGNQEGKNYHSIMKFLLKMMTSWVGQVFIFPYLQTFKLENNVWCQDKVNKLCKLKTKHSFIQNQVDSKAKLVWF